MELVNVDPAVMKYIYTLFSADSCAPVLGQIALDLMTHPPQPGDPSYPLYDVVRPEICNSLLFLRDLKNGITLDLSLIILLFLPLTLSSAGDTKHQDHAGSKCEESP